MGRTTARSVMKKNDDAPFPATTSDAETAATAKYIADMTAELSKLAGGARMPMLVYFLNLARVEAEMRARDHGGYPIACAD